MRRWIGVAAIVVLALSGGGVWMATAVAQVDGAAFCQSRSDLAAAFAQEDGDAARAVVDALTTSAPAQLVKPVERLGGVVTKRGLLAFETKKATKAFDAIDEYVVASCEFPILGVNGTDYQFQGISDTLTAGSYVIEFTNGAPAEHHEMVVSRVRPGVNVSVKKLLALSEQQLEDQTVVLGSAFAEPDETDTLVVYLEPGRHVLACFIDVGTTSGDDGNDEHGVGEHGGAAEPHWKEGMRGEFEVVGGA